MSAFLVFIVSRAVKVSQPPICAHTNRRTLVTLQELPLIGDDVDIHHHASCLYVAAPAYWWWCVWVDMEQTAE